MPQVPNKGEEVERLPMAISARFRKFIGVFLPRILALQLFVPSCQWVCAFRGSWLGLLESGATHAERFEDSAFEVGIEAGCGCRNQASLLARVTLLGLRR